MNQYLNIIPLLVLIFLFYVILIRPNFSPIEYESATEEQINKNKILILESLYEKSPSENEFYNFEDEVLNSLGLNPRQFKEVMIHLIQTEGRCLVHPEDAGHLQGKNLHRGKYISHIRFALSHKGYHEILNSKSRNTFTLNNISIEDIENLLVNERSEDIQVEEKLEMILSEIKEIKELQRNNLSPESLSFIKSLSTGMITNSLYDALKYIARSGGYISE